MELPGGGGHVSPAENVFAIEELLERILDYSTVGMKRSQLLEFRLVGKHWRKAVYQLISKTKPFLVVLKSNADNVIGMQEILSPDCCLPLKIHIGSEDLKPFHAQFINDYKFNIVEIRFWNIRNINCDSLTLALPFLKKLEVAIMDGSVFYPSGSPMAALLENIVSNSERLGTYYLRVFLRENTEFHGNLLPKELTHLLLSCQTTEQIEKTTSSNLLSKLTDFEIEVANGSKGERMDISHALRSLRNLKRLKIRTSGREMLVLNQDQFNHLTDLDTDTHVETEDGKSLSSVLPSIVNLAFCCFRSTMCDLKLLTRKDTLFKNLKSLKIINTHGSNSVECEEAAKMLSEIMPALTSITVDSNIDYLMPVIFSTMTKLQILDFSFYNTSRETVRDLIQILTGLHRFPNNETLWPNLLLGKTNALTNLTEIRELRLAGMLSQKPFVGNFLFTAVFFQMPNLQKLKFTNITVDPEMELRWRNEGREIEIKE